jgi:hypothetical protein
MADVVRNIILFVLVGAVIVVGILYLASEINSEKEGSAEGLASTTSLVSHR